MIGTIFLFLDALGGGEMFVIILVVLLLFGPDKLSGIAKAIGKGIRQINDVKEQVHNEIQKNTGNLHSEIEKHTSEIKSEIEKAGQGMTQQLNKANKTILEESKAITDVSKEEKRH